MKKKYIFVYGPDRSGGTLLTSLLSGHSSIFTAGITHDVFRGVYVNREEFLSFIKRGAAMNIARSFWYHTKMLRLHASSIRGVIEYSKAPREYSSSVNFSFNRDVFFNELYKNFGVIGDHGVQVSNIHDIIESFFTSWALAVGEESRPFFAVKLTHDIGINAEADFMNLIEGFDPVILWVGRDPRAIAVSKIIKDKTLGNETNKEFMLNDWISHHDSHYLYTKRFPILDVNYERLCNETSTVMREVADFLKIPFEDSLIQPEFEGQPFTGNSAFGKIGSSVSPSSINKWKTLFSEEDVYRVEKLVGSRLEKAGYKPRYPDLMKRTPPLRTTSSQFELSDFFPKRRLYLTLWAFTLGLAAGLLLYNLYNFLK